MTDDYLRATWLFKVRKGLRYLRLFGISRTLVKIRGQYHLKAAEGFDGPTWVNPACREPESAARDVAIIGCGNYPFSNVGFYLAKHEPRFLRATYDVLASRARSLCRTYGGAYAAADWTAILRDPRVKLVYITSNHASHAEYAVACIEAGKHVHIEKPHVVSQEQLDRLVAAMRAHPQVKVFLGFNRPRSVLFRKLQDVLATQSGPLMINWFIVGHAIAADHWYYDQQEGGRVLGNLCHWTDLTLQMVSREKAFPCTIIPASPPGSRSDAVVSVIFADRSCATITFSAKEYTFEGVREELNVHQGHVVANLSDFQSLRYDIAEKKRRHVLCFRDHGHEANILHSLRGSRNGEGERPSYVEDTARFFLAIRVAVDSGERVVLS